MRGCLEMKRFYSWVFRSEGREQPNDFKSVVELFENQSGVGLWRCQLYNGDISHEKTVLTWSDGMRQIFGYTDESDYPNTVEAWVSGFHPEDLDRVLTGFQAHLNDKSGRTPLPTNIYRYRMKSGEYRWFQGRGGSTRDAQGNVLWSCGSIIDINDMKLAQIEQELLAASNKVVVSAMAASLSKLAKGNLVDRMDHAFPAEFETLRDDFNQAVDGLRSAIVATSHSAELLASGCQEIATSSKELERRTERQTHGLSEAVSALNETTVTMRNAAAAADQAKQLVSTVRTEAGECGIVARQAVSGMQQISASSQQINSIIAVIDEIAFQTNLLALNAGVEAARAGDAGRGFAVVASEVRALAQRSAAAAREIKELIVGSGIQVKDGVRLVGLTVDGLEKISSQISAIDDFVAAIAQSAQHQAQGINQLSDAVKRIDHVTQENAAMVKDSARHTQYLEREIHNLLLDMQRFTTVAKTKPLQGFAA